MTTNARIVLGTALGAALVLAVVCFLGLRPTPGDAQLPKSEGAGAHEAKETSGRDPSPAARSQDAPVQARTSPTVAGSSSADSDDEALAEVSIIVAGTGEPAVAADVWSWRGAASIGGDEGFEAWLRASTVEERAASALHLFSDSTGRVRVPDHELGFVVAARAGESWGYASFDPQRRATTPVELRPDRDLRVRVVDAKGAPVAGALVALVRRRLDAEFVPRTARTSAAEGMAVLRHVAPFVDASSEGGGFAVELEGLFDPPVQQRLEGAREGPFELTLPPCGSCSVSIVDASGATVELPFEARLQFAESSADPSSAPFATSSSRFAGAAVFEHVQLGRTLTVRVRREGSNETLEAIGSGPRTPGERVELRVALGAGLAVLRATVLDSAGKPLANARLEASIAADAAPAEGEWRVLTGNDGGLALALPADVAPRPGRSLVLAQRSSEGAVLALARAPLPDELGPRSHELGQLVLSETPALAAGRVVDRRGAPVARARITPIAALAQSNEEGSSPDTWLAPARSDSHGRFEIRGLCSATTIALDAEKEGLVGETREVRTGARGIELVLGASGSIAGRILLDPTLAASTLLVHASASDRDTAGATAPCAPSVDGRFELRDLRPGRYALSVAYAPTGRELASLEDLVVAEGRSARDERLDPIDLRGRWRSIELEPFDASGAAVAGASVLARPSGEEGARWTYCRAEGGRVPILADARPVDVVVAASGFQRVSLERVDASRRVQLAAAARLRLELVGARTPEPPLRLGARLVPLDAGRWGGFSQGGVEYFDSNGVLQCQASFLGAATVELVLESGGQQPAPAVWLPRGGTGEVEVDERGGVQVFEIRVDPAALEAAARELRSER